MADQVTAYSYLQRHLQVFCSTPLIGFDPLAATMMQHLQQQRIRIGTMDLRIASIAPANGATLLTRNVTDFQKVPGLRFKDWIVYAETPHSCSPPRDSQIAYSSPN